MKRTTAFQNGLIWFGAGVSLAEILTGTYFAPLGMGRGIAAILLGHVIGCVLFFLAGLIGGRERKSSMETVKMSFGAKGGMLFAFLNVVQLVGWTGIMIYDGALATNSIFDVGIAVWSIVIGVMIVIWIAIGVTNLGLLNKITMALLFILTVVLSVVVFRGNNPGATSGEVITFGMAVENAVAMPLSWLPVISDYTREADKPFRATLASTVTYGLVSCWMYVIGMGAAIYTGGSDIAQVMLKAGLGISALLIMILSTVTTTFLDAFSAGVSCESLSKKLSGKDCGHHRHRHRHHRRLRLQHGQHHGLPLHHRQRVRAHDRRAADDLLHPQKRQLRRRLRLAEPHRLGRRFRRLPPDDARGPAHGLHAPLRAHHHGPLLRGKQAHTPEKQITKGPALNAPALRICAAPQRRMLQSTRCSPILYTSPAPTVRMMSPGCAVSRRLRSMSAKSGQNMLPSMCVARSAEEMPSVFCSRAA